MSGTNLGYAHGYVDIDTSGIDRSLNNAQRNFDNFIGSTGRQMQTWGNNMSSVGSQMTMFTAPIAALGAYGIGAASSFQDSMSQIEARTGLTGDALERVRAKAMELGRDTKFSANEAADAFLQLTTAGLSAEQAYAAVDAVMYGAAAGNFEIAEAADLATNVMSSFGLEAEDVTGIMDMMFKASASSPATMAEMGEALARAGGFATNFGLDMEETTAILAVFAQRGVRGGEAATQLRSVLKNMSADTADATGTWAELGISMFDAEGNMRDMNDIFGDLNGALDGMADEDRIRITQTLAGAYGQVGFNALMSTGAIEEMTETLDGQADYVSVAQKMMQTFSGEMLSLKGSFESLLIHALTPFMDNFLTPMIVRTRNVVNGVSDWIQANQELTGKIVKFLGLAVAMGPTLFIVGKAVSFVGFALTALASPLLWAIGLGALFVAGYQSNFMGMQEKLAPMITFFQNLFSSMFSFDGSSLASSPILGFFMQMSTMAQAVFGRLLSFIWAFFDTLNQGGSIVDAFRMAIASSLFGTGLGGMVLNFFNIFVTGLQNIGTWVSTVALPALLMLGNWFLTSILPAIVSFVTTIAIPMILSFVAWLGNIWTMVAPHLMSLFNWFMTTGLPMITNFISNTVIPTLMSMAGFLMRLWTDVSPFLTFLVDWFLVTALPMVMAFINESVIPVIQNFIGLLSDIWLFVQPHLQSFYDWFITTGLPIIEAYITGPFTNGLQGLLNIFAGAWEFVSVGITAFRDNIGGVFTWIMDNAIQPVINMVERLFGMFTDTIGKAGELASMVPGVSEGAAGFGVAGNAMGMLASGEVSAGEFGNALWNATFGGSQDIGGSGEAGRAYMIGTGAQPEMFVPSSDGEFIPNADRQGGGISLYGTTIVANDPEDLGRQLRELELAEG